MHWLNLVINAWGNLNTTELCKYEFKKQIKNLAGCTVASNTYVHACNLISDNSRKWHYVYIYSTLCTECVNVICTCIDSVVYVGVCSASVTSILVTNLRNMHKCNFLFIWSWMLREVNTDNQSGVLYITYQDI